MTSDYGNPKKSLQTSLWTIGSVLDGPKKRIEPADNDEQGGPLYDCDSMVRRVCSAILFDAPLHGQQHHSKVRPRDLNRMDRLTSWSSRLLAVNDNTSLVVTELTFLTSLCTHEH